MKTRHLVLTAATSSLLAAAARAAEEGEGPANPLAVELVPFVTTLVVFGIVFFILSSQVWPRINKALADREAKIRTEIEEAEMSRKQANAALQQYEQALAEARTEANQIIESTRADAQKLASELRAKAEAEINSMKESAQRDIESAKRAALSEIYSQMATTASAIAGRILQREIKPEDQQQLIEESLAELESVRSN